MGAASASPETTPTSYGSTVDGYWRCNSNATSIKPSFLRSRTLLEKWLQTSSITPFHQKDVTNGIGFTQRRLRLTFWPSRIELQARWARFSHGCWFLQEVSYPNESVWFEWCQSTKWEQAFLNGLLTYMLTFQRNTQSIDIDEMKKKTMEDLYPPSKETCQGYSEENYYG